MKKLIFALIGFATGTLIGVSLLHMLPEAIEGLGPSSFHYTVLGIISFFVMEKFLYWRHCHDMECSIHSFVYLNLFGDGLHNLIDGLIIAASFLHSSELGVAATLAVILHEIPQELGDFGVLIYGGLGKSRALLLNLVSALTAVLGALIAYYTAFYIHEAVLYLIPFAAGGLIYIAAVDLMPELHKRNSPRDALTQLIMVIAGLSVMLLLKH
ncbi:ZIP family metal transporter [Candidatus Bathyarchaeota archaeon]|nr:ZIP family metal transporter [Candidatus Bathyarchaeota archaeon]